MKQFRAREQERNRIEAIVRAAKALQKASASPPPQSDSQPTSALAAIRHRSALRQQLADDVDAWLAAGNQIEELPTYEPVEGLSVARAYDRTQGGAWNQHQ